MCLHYAECAASATSALFSLQPPVLRSALSSLLLPHFRALTCARDFRVGSFMLVRTIRRKRRARRARRAIDDAVRLYSLCDAKMNNVMHAPCIILLECVPASKCTTYAS